MIYRLRKEGNWGGGKEKKPLLFKQEVKLRRVMAQFDFPSFDSLVLTFFLPVGFV